MPQPLSPARRDQLAAIQRERQPKTVRGIGIGIVSRGHREVHQRMHLGAAQVLPSMDALQKTLDAAVVGTVLACRHRAGVRLAIGEPRLSILRELIERIRPVCAIDEVEVGVARVIGNGAPVPGVLHAVNNRAVAARRLAETTAVLARCQGAEFAIDERDQLAGQVVGVAPDRARVDVLVAAERREAIRKHDDARVELPVMNQPGRTFRHILLERAPVRVRLAAAGVANEVEQHRKPLRRAPPSRLVVLRRQPDIDQTIRRIAERVVAQNLRAVLDGDDAARRASRPLKRHPISRRPWPAG